MHLLYSSLTSMCYLYLPLLFKQTWTLCELSSSNFNNGEKYNGRNVKSANVLKAAFKQSGLSPCYWKLCYLYFIDRAMTTEERGRDAARVTMDPERLEQHIKRAQEVIENDKKSVPPFWINKYKKEAARNWDIFYKRNTTKFFKDRHWTDREFEELRSTEKVSSRNAKTSRIQS